MTKDELVENIQNLFERYRQDLVQVSDGLATICINCWEKESAEIKDWTNLHLENWKIETE